MFVSFLKKQETIKSKKEKELIFMSVTSTTWAANNPNVVRLALESFAFPCGEPHIKVLRRSQPYHENHDVMMNFKSSDDIIELLILVDAIKRSGGVPSRLVMPYVPFGRQDRINEAGEPLSIKVFAGLINSLNFEEVHILDPHSDVTPALINNCIVVHQHDIFKENFEDMPDIKKICLVCPDAGAEKKTYKLAQEIGCNHILFFRKVRDPITGDIKSLSLDNVMNIPIHDFHCFIVDDICDGGRTFIEIAKILKPKNPIGIDLMVTHGFFTKGLDVFEGHIDRIWVKNEVVKVFKKNNKEEK